MQIMQSPAKLAVATSAALLASGLSPAWSWCEAQIHDSPMRRYHPPVPLPRIDYLVLLAYLAGVVAFGCWFIKRNRTAADFMIAGGSMPGWAVGLSILGAFVSSISLLGLPSTAFAGNWNRFCFSLGLPVALVIAVKWFIPFYRRSGYVSAYQHLEHRFGAWARTYAVVCYLLIMMARMGTTLYLLALALSPMLGWDIRLIIVLTGALITLYTVVGGSEAVIWTDTVHNIILIVGVAACVAIQLGGMPQGPAQTFHIASEHNKFALGSAGPALSAPTIWAVLLYGLFENLRNFGIDQSYVQRYLTARDEREARKSLWLGGLTYVPLSAVLLFIGTALFAFYAVRPGVLPADVAKRPDDVFPYFITHQLPAGMTGLVIAAIFAAAMNGFGLNIVSTITLCDLYERYVRPGATEREKMTVLYASTVGWGAAATAVACAMISVRQALDAWWELAAVFGGGMLGLFLLGILSKRAGSAAAAVGVSAGVAVILWMTLSPRWKAWPDALRSPFHPFLISAFGTVTVLGVGWLVAQLKRPGPRLDAPLAGRVSDPSP
jgi:SSS family solute:Na+ symporter